jgi:hypothetical protein
VRQRWLRIHKGLMECYGIWRGISTEIFYDRQSLEIMSNSSRISFRIVLRPDTPGYVIDFFLKGLRHEELPTVLYDYGFTFDHRPSLQTGTYLFCQLVEKIDKDGGVESRYHLCIEHEFDFDDEVEAAKGYWFVGGLAQYAENSNMAGYITHQDGSTQLFGFKDKLNFFVDNIKMNFDESNRVVRFDHY